MWLAWREGRGDQDNRRPLLKTGNHYCLSHDKGPHEPKLQFSVSVYLLRDCREVLNIPGTTDNSEHVKHE